MTYVRVKLAMESMAPGELLEVFLLGAEPLRNVPQSAIDDGHEVLLWEPYFNEAIRLMVRVGGSEKP